MLTDSPEWFSCLNANTRILASFGANIPSDNSTPWGMILGVGMLAAVGFAFWNKIVVEKNTPAAVLVGAVLIVITLIALHGCE